MEQRRIKEEELNEYCFTADNLIKKGYKYAWVQSISEVSLEVICESSNYDTEDILEARFFSEDRELHFFRNGSIPVLVETVKEVDDIKCNDNYRPIVNDKHVHEYIEEKQLLRGRFGNTITLRSYIGYDDDGQAYVKCTVLAGFERGGNNA